LEDTVAIASVSGRRALRVSTPLPDKVLRKFGGLKARPRLVQVYNPRRGWKPERRREPLTLEALADLKGLGITRVEARWRRRRVRINLFTVGVPAT
jgi:hypothetical protein